MRGHFSIAGRKPVGTLAAAVMSAVAVLGDPALAADFLFNFNPSATGTQVPGGVNATGTYITNNDGTRFYQDVVNIGGQDYFHVVVGDPATGFAQEYYTTGVYANTGQGSGTRSYSLDSGGNEASLLGKIDSTNLPNDVVRNRIGNAREPFGVRLTGTDQVVPLDQRYRVSGNGTMDPSRMVLRMQLSDADISMEVFKPILNRKPQVSQTVIDGDLSSLFVADMRGLSYQESNRPAPIINRLSLTDATLPTQGSADFDMSMADKSYVTAGRFIYAPGTKWNTTSGWDVAGSTFNPGTYIYSDGNFDVLSADWIRFWDKAQNPVNPHGIIPYQTDWTQFFTP